MTPEAFIANLKENIKGSVKAKSERHVIKIIVDIPKQGVHIFSIHTKNDIPPKVADWHVKRIQKVLACG